MAKETSRDQMQVRYFNAYLAKYSYQKMLTVRAECTLTFSQLQVLSACYYSEHPPSTAWLQRCTGLSKPTILRNTKLLVGQDLIDKKHIVTPTLKGQKWVVMLSGKPAYWKLLARKDLKPLENRIFSLLASLEHDGIIAKSKGSISRLVRSGDRHGTRAALQALADKGLVKIGSERLKVLPPKADYWMLRKDTVKPPKIDKMELAAPAVAVPAAARSELQKAIDQEVKNRFIDPDAPFVAPMVDAIARFFKSLGLKGKDSNRETEKVLEHFIEYHLTHNRMMSTLYLSYEIQLDWAEKLIQRYDPARTRDAARYLFGCIDKLGSVD
jgi:hypothetical protein